MGANGFSNVRTDRSGNNPTSDGANPTDGKVATFGNGTMGATWGGYGGTMVNGVYHPELNGANADIGRMQGLGAAAANRSAYVNNYAQANQDAEYGRQDRKQQGMAANLSRDVALNGDAQSQALGQRMLQQGVQTQQAAALSARGGALAQAAAMRQQQNGQGAFMQQGQNSLAAQRADDMAAGRSQYMQDLTQMRQQDAQVQGLHQSQAIHQAGNEIDQRDLNQQGQMGYEQMGQNVSKAAGSAQLGGYEIDAGIDAAAAARANASANRNQQTTGALMGTGGAFVASVGGAIPNSGGTSKPTGASPGYYNADGTPISGAGGGFDPDHPGTTSDERAKRNVRGLAAASVARKGGY